MFDERAAEGFVASYELRLGEDRFRAVVDRGRFKVERGGADSPDAIIETNPATLAALIYEGRSLAGALRSGEVKIEGDGQGVARFLGFFSLPEPVEPAVGA
jgi:putative sterol carrier protein